MREVREATHVTETWKDIFGGEHYVSTKLFEEEEVERAETIINSLEGLTIESAQTILRKVNKYILQITLH